jgi:hypothetical protein
MFQSGKNQASYVGSGTERFDLGMRREFWQGEPIVRIGCEHAVGVSIPCEHFVGFMENAVLERVKSHPEPGARGGNFVLRRFTEGVGIAIREECLRLGFLEKPFEFFVCIPAANDELGADRIEIVRERGQAFAEVLLASGAGP